MNLWRKVLNKFSSMLLTLFIKCFRAIQLNFIVIKPEYNKTCWVYPDWLWHHSPVSQKRWNQTTWLRKASRCAVSYLEQQVVFEDPLNWFEQVWTEWQRALQWCLTFPKKLCQRFIPHTLRQRCNRTAAGWKRQKVWTGTLVLSDVNRCEQVCTSINWLKQVETDVSW